MHIQFGQSHKINSILASTRTTTIPAPYLIRTQKKNVKMRKKNGKTTTLLQCCYVKRRCTIFFLFNFQPKIAFETIHFCRQGLFATNATTKHCKSFTAYSSLSSIHSHFSFSLSAALLCFCHLTSPIFLLCFISWYRSLSLSQLCSRVSLCSRLSFLLPFHASDSISKVYFPFEF